MHYENIHCVHPNFEKSQHPITKYLVMPSRAFLNCPIILAFIGSAGFCLAKAIYYGSVMGIILAMTSIGAAIFFLYLVAKARKRACLE